MFADWATTFVEKFFFEGGFFLGYGDDKLLLLKLIFVNTFGLMPEAKVPIWIFGFGGSSSRDDPLLSTFLGCKSMSYFDWDFIFD